MKRIGHLWNRVISFGNLVLAYRKARKGKRVIRGGSWNNTTEWLRSSARNRNNTDNRDNNIGFRVLRSASPPSCQSPSVHGQPERAQGVHDPFSGLRKDGKAE